MSTTTTTTTSLIDRDQVSLSDDGDDHSASPQVGLPMYSPDLLLTACVGPGMSTTNSLQSDVGALLSDDGCSTDADEWSLTSGLATVDSDD